MSMWESILVAVDNLRVNKLRAFLTMIGIVFGVMAVVTVVSIGQAGQASILSELSNFDEGYFIIYKSEEGTRTNAEIDMRDLSEARKVEGVKFVSSTINMMMSASQGNEKLQFSISGTTSDIVKMQKVNIVAGRFFNAQEQRARQKVIVVDTAFAEKVYGTAERALNRNVKMSGGSFRIIGVYKPQTSIFGGVGGTRYNAYAPLETMQDTGPVTGRYLDTLEAVAESPDQLEETMKRLKQMLAQRHNADVDDFNSRSGKEVQEEASNVFGILQLVIGSIAGISLLVGGIGIMNIMLVSVTERTREIGIRKAIGAAPGAIKLQFLIESVILSFIGGMTGALLGLSVGALASAILGLPYVVSIWAMALAFGFSVTVGIFFGYYPANKAAKLQPIEALRYE